MRQGPFSPQGILSRRLAEARHYPAIDVLASISRLANRVSGEKTKEACAYVRKLMATYAESEDIINVGAYQKGSNPNIDLAIDAHKNIDSFLEQEEFEQVTIDDTMQKLAELAHLEIPQEEYNV